MSTVHRRSLLALALIALVVMMAPGSVRPTVRAGGSVDDAITEQQRMAAELRASASSSPTSAASRPPSPPASPS